MPAEFKQATWKTIDPGLMALSILAGLLPLAVVTIVNTTVLHLQRMPFVYVIAMVISPSWVLMAGNMRKLTRSNWISRVGVLLLAQFLGHVAVLLANHQAVLPTTYTTKLFISWAGLIPAMVIPLFTTEDPKRSDAMIAESKRRKLQLVMIATGLMMSALCLLFGEVFPNTSFLR